MPSQCMYYLGVFDPLYPSPPLLYKMKYNHYSPTVTETDDNQFMKCSKKKVPLTFNSGIQPRLCQLNTEELTVHGLFECKLWSIQILVSEQYTCWYICTVLSVKNWPYYGRTRTRFLTVSSRHVRNP